MGWSNCSQGHVFSVTNFDRDTSDPKDMDLLCPQCAQDWRELVEWVESLGFHLIEPTDLEPAESILESAPGGCWKSLHVFQISRKYFDLCVPVHLSEHAYRVMQETYWDALQAIDNGEDLWGEWDRAWDDKEKRWLVRPVHFPETRWWHIEFVRDPKDYVTA